MNIKFNELVKELRDVAEFAISDESYEEHSTENKHFIQLVFANCTKYLDRIDKEENDNL